MEKKALQLMSDNKALALALEQTTRRKDMEIRELQGHIATVSPGLPISFMCDPQPSLHEAYKGMRNDMHVAYLGRVRAVVMPPNCQRVLPAHSLFHRW